MTISNDPTVKAAMIQLNRSYLNLENRIIEKPDDFINGLNRVKYETFDSRNVWTVILEGMLDRQVLTLEDSERFKLRFPFSYPIEIVLRNTHERLTLKPTSTMQMSLLRNFLKKRGSSESPPRNINVNTYPIPLPISREAFETYCENSKAKYYYNNSFAWACEQAQNEVFIPKDKIITADAMKIIISSLAHRATTNVITRLVAGLDSEFLNVPEATNQRLRNDLKNMVIGSYYMFDSQNPNFSEDCITRDESFVSSVEVRVDCRKNRTFTKITADSQPPAWVKTTEDLVFWKVAMVNLTTELQLYGQDIPTTFESNLAEILADPSAGDQSRRAFAVNRLNEGAYLSVGFHSESSADYVHQVYLLPSHQMIPQGGTTEHLVTQPPQSKALDANGFLFNAATQSLARAIKYSPPKQ